MPFRPFSPISPMDSRTPTSAPVLFPPPPRSGYAPPPPIPVESTPAPTARFELLDNALALRLEGISDPKAVTAAELLLVKRSDQARTLRLRPAEWKVEGTALLFRHFSFGPQPDFFPSPKPVRWLVRLLVAKGPRQACFSLQTAPAESAPPTISLATSTAAWPNRPPLAIWPVPTRPGSPLLLESGAPVWALSAALKGTRERLVLGHSSKTLHTCLRFPPPPPAARWTGAILLAYPDGSDEPLLRPARAIGIRSSAKATRITATFDLNELLVSAESGAHLTWTLCGVLELAPPEKTSAIPSPTPTVRYIPVMPPRRPAVMAGLRLLFQLMRRPVTLSPALSARWQDLPYRSGLLVAPPSPLTLADRLADTFVLLLALLLSPILRPRRYWLFYEKDFAARENAYALFRHCVETGVEKTRHVRLRYACDPASPTYARALAPLDHGRVVRPASLRHRLLAVNAHLLLGTDTKYRVFGLPRHDTPCGLYVLLRRPLWLLEHGIKAFKFPDGYTARSLDYMTCSNASEHAWMVQSGRWPAARVVTTGLARWDLLRDRAADRARPLVLVMPTYRLWLDGASPEAFATSDYARRWLEFLTSPALHDWLARRDLDLAFHTHPHLDPLVATFRASLPARISVFSADEPPLAPLIEQASLLVTDYSSIAFHGLFLDKPVVYYPFDLDRFVASSNPLLRLPGDFPGPAPTTLPALLAAMEDAAARHWTLAPEDRPRRDTFFAFRDHHNCDRILSEILARSDDS